MSVTQEPRRTVRTVAALTIAGLGGVLAGCAVDASVDCGRVCDKYQDCIDPDYDVRACGDRCQSSGDSQARADQLDACERCIDDKTCGSASSDCDDDCVGIVP